MLGTRLLTLPLGLLQGVLLARGLGPQQLGRYSAALVDVNLLVTVLSLGLPGALAVLCAEAKAEKSALRSLWRVAQQRGVLLPVGGLVIAGLGLLWPRSVDWLLRGREPLLLGLIAVTVAVQYARDVHNSLLWGGQQFSAQNRLTTGLAVGQLVASAALVLLGVLTMQTALLLQCASLAAVALLSGRWVALRLATAEALEVADSRSLTSWHKRAFTVGLRNFLHILPDLLLLRIDVYLIQRLLPVELADQQLGIYQAGVRVAELLLLVPSTLNTVLFAKAAAREDIAQVALRGARLALWLGILACLGMGLLGQPLLMLFYGARFAGSFAPCLLVLLGCTALCFSGPLSGTLAGDGGYPRSVIVSQSVALVVNVIANLVLLPRYGIVGAAAASTLAYTVSAALTTWAFAQRFRLPLRQVLRLQSPLTLVRELRAPQTASDA